MTTSRACPCHDGQPGVAAAVVSFGYRYGDPPAAHVTFDLRRHFRDPHASGELRHLTARDSAVHDAVMATPGIPQLLEAAEATVTAYLSGPSPRPVTVAVGCAGGRHRAAVVAQALATRLGCPVEHRDLHRPVVDAEPHPGYEIVDTGDGHITRSRGAGWRRVRIPAAPSDLPGLPPGIHPADRCPAAPAVADGHQPHLWARRNQDEWDVIRPGADPPPGALWCDGQAR